MKRLRPSVGDLFVMPRSFRRAATVEACAEMGCLSQALDAGVNPSGGHIRVVGDRNIESGTRAPEGDLHQLLGRSRISWGGTMNASEYLRSAQVLELAEGIDSWTALMRVLSNRLDGLVMPEELRPIRDRARRYWECRERADLHEAKVATWTYIGGLASSATGLGSPDDRAARALLCLLEPGGSDEARSMTAEWFAGMVDG